MNVETVLSMRDEVAHGDHSFVILDLGDNRTIKITPDGDKFWWVNGKLHRTDGPGIECIDGSKCWYLNGQRHRADGAAVEYADGSKGWWLNNKQLSEEQWKQQASKLTAPKR